MLSKISNTILSQLCVKHPILQDNTSRVIHLEHRHDLNGD